MEKQKRIPVVQIAPHHVLVSFPKHYDVEMVFRMLHDLKRVTERAAKCSLLFDLREASLGKMTPSLFSACLETVGHLRHSVAQLVILLEDGLTASATAATVDLLPISFSVLLSRDCVEAEKAWGYRLPCEPCEDNKRLPSR